MNLKSQLKTTLKGLIPTSIVGGAVYAYISGQQMLALTLLIVGVVLLGLIGIFVLINKAATKKKANEMDGMISRHNSATGAAGGQVQLDDLRQNFAKGLQKFKDAGKDIYSLPWFVVVGEPGSGKTEAIRRSSVGFPPGLQDLLQGAGGTISMHWWFTNYGVILDTAGKLFFEETSQDLVSNWNEFLNLLRKCRNRCPINGLLLVIPTESLIQDSAEELEDKAKVLAVRLDEMQRELKVRFPVFVTVTKCDKLAGFREFFQNIEDPDKQHQMLGWSNPNPLDTPFQPQALEDYLSGLTDVIEGRRLGLIKDPIPENPDGNFLDDADSLYAFPRSLESIYPRLKRYLELIFVAGEWAQNPLFLRGIYFTSSLQEGAALDEDLAEALGIDTENLPEDGVFKREKAFFLRDIFTAKIFKESGLVTSAANTSSLLRKKFLLVYGLGSVAMITLFFFSWFASKSLEQAVGEQRDYWVAAASDDLWTDQDGWRYSLVKDGFGAGTWKSEEGRLIDVGASKVKQVDFLTELNTLSQKPIEMPWVFKPMAALFKTFTDREYDREPAYEIVFRKSVVEPLISTSRTVLEESTQGRTVNPNTPEVLMALMRWEAAYVDATPPTGTEEDEEREFVPALTVSEVAPILAPTYRYLTASDIDPRLPEIFKRVYSQEGVEEIKWPLPGLSGGSSLQSNEAINKGLTSMMNTLRRNFVTNNDSFSQIDYLFREVDGYASAEKAYWRKVESEGGSFDGIPNIVAYFDRDLSKKSTSLVSARQSMLSQGLASSPDGVQLSPMLEGVIDKAEREVRNTVNPLAKFFGEQDIQVLEKRPDFSLYRDVRKYIEDSEYSLEQDLNNKVSDLEKTRMREYDRDYLNIDSKTNDPYFLYRFSLYERVNAVLNQSVTKDVPVEIGRFSAQVSNIKGELAKLQDAVNDYSGPFKQEFTVACSRQIELTRQRMMTDVTENYMQNLSSYLRQNIRFPMVSDGSESNALSVDQLATLTNQLKMLRSDLTTVTPPAISGALRARYEKAIKVLDDFIQHGDALLANVQDPVVWVSMPALDDQYSRLSDMGYTEHIEKIWQDIRFGEEPERRLRGSEAVRLGDFHYCVNDFRMSFLKNGAVDASVNVRIDPPWATIKMMRSYNAADSTGDGGRTWDIPLRITQGGKSYYMLIELEFQNPIPPQRNWPQTASTVF